MSPTLNPHGAPPEPAPGFADHDDARRRYRALLLRLGATKPASDGGFEPLWAAWASPERAYHDLRHLGACLGWLERSPLVDHDRDLAELALWWHDALMAGPSAEADSAAWMRRACDEAGLPAAVLDRVEALVMATAHGHPEAGAWDAVADVVHDCDLAILAAGPERFEAFEDGVRQEYAWVDDLGFAVGRSHVLRGLLDRPAIFRSAWGLDLMEGPARANLRETLAGPRYLLARSGDGASG